MAFSMEQIGRRISERRKEKNMTQMELTDRMGISFQAVSNWERCNSMPDISKLPGLAQILDLSLDSLLGNGESAELLKHAAEGKTEEFVRENRVSQRAFEEVAPLLSPKDADVVFENTTPPFDLSDIAEILPFISERLIDDLFRRGVENKNYQDLDDLEELFPFVSPQLLSEMVEQFLYRDEEVASCFPFLSAEQVDRVSAKIYETYGLEGMDDRDCFPFMSDEALAETAWLEFEKSGLNDMDILAPFLRQALLHELAKKAVAKDGIKALVSLAPFLDKSLLEEWLKELL